MAAIYGEQQVAKQSSSNDHNNSKQEETFMKTDDLIDLFSIDPATGREKQESPDQIGMLFHKLNLIMYRRD